MLPYCGGKVRTATCVTAFKSSFQEHVLCLPHAVAWLPQLDLNAHLPKPGAPVHVRGCRYLNRNAYIMVAVKGSNYCISAARAMQLIAKVGQR